MEIATTEIFAEEKGEIEEVLLDYFEYDRNNNQIFKLTKRGDNVLFEVKSSYDQRNRVVSEEVWSIEEEEKIIVKTEYDALDNIIKESVFQNGLLVEETKCVINAKNQMTRFDFLKLAVDNYPYRNRYYYEYEN